MLYPDEESRSLVLGALCSACTLYNAEQRGDGGSRRRGRGRGNLQDPRDLTHSSRVCVCLHNIRPYATCPSHTYHCFFLFPPSSFFLFVFHLSHLLLLSLLRLSLLLEREVEEVLLRCRSPTLDPMPANGASRCPWRRAGPRVG